MCHTVIMCVIVASLLCDWVTLLYSAVSDQSDCTPTQLIMDKCGVETMREGEPELQ